jgi:hypothetical protein
MIRNVRFNQQAKPVIRAFGAAFLSACALMLGAHTTPAEAKWTRTHASGCIAVNPGLRSPYDVSFALWNDSTTGEMTLLCPLSDTDYLPKTSLTSLNIHGKDGHPSRNVDAMLCRSNWASTGGGCSAIVSSPTGTADYTLQPNRSILTGRTTDFAYVWVRLPRKSGSSRSGLRGFYTAN